MLSASQQQALTSPIPKPIIHTIHSCISLLFFFQNFCWNFEKFHILKKRKSLKINLFEVFFLLISKHIVCSFISLRSCKESNHFSHQSRFASNCKQSFKVTWLMPKIQTSSQTNRGQTCGNKVKLCTFPSSF